MNSIRFYCKRRAKQRELQTIENELQVLNGLQEGETLSVGKAYSTLDKINKVKEETVETNAIETLHGYY